MAAVVMYPHFCVAGHALLPSAMNESNSLNVSESLVCAGVYNQCTVVIVYSTVVAAESQGLRHFVRGGVTVPYAYELSSIVAPWIAQHTDALPPA